MPRTRHAALACMLTLAPAADAQNAPPASPPAAQVTIADALAQVNRADAARRAGLRADLLRRAQQVVPAVVIVTDARAYLEAISAWEGTRRFPVLWDDGSIRAREDIARFVRAFEPEKVYRYTSGTEAPVWPVARPDREAAFMRALSRAADEKSADFNASLHMLREQGIVSPGIVLTDVDDTAWPAALALAAARLQPVAFVDNPANIWQPLTSDQADLFENAAQELARSTGLKWEAQGDDIDAVALCANTAVKMKFGPGDSDIYATSARVGRFGPNGTGERWANTGQVFGGYTQSVYRAMCALFLSPRDAFIFDGYDDTQPWNAYDGRQAASLLEGAGFEVQLHDLPGNTAAHWTSLTARPVRPALWLINSHGQAWVMNFQKGKVPAMDTPLMDRPTVVHIVHSFSTSVPGNRGTVAGSFLDRGAYAMLGSVDEPFLQAFVPTPNVAGRLLAGYNFAAAVRYDDAPVWKLAVLGDPLITVGPAGTRLENTTPDMPGTLTDLKEELSDALARRDLPMGVTYLTLLGRDHDAARLVAAAAAKPETPINAELAAAAIPALFRDSRHELVVTAFANLTDEQRAETVLADCFWFAGRFLLTSSTDSAKAERLMRLYQRPDNIVGDAEELAARFRARSLEDAVLFLESVRPRLTRDHEIRALEAALTRLRTGG
jgi:hypothetical protein